MTGLKTTPLLLLVFISLTSRASFDNLDSIDKILNQYDLFCFHDSKKEIAFVKNHPQNQVGLFDSYYYLKEGQPRFVNAWTGFNDGNCWSDSLCSEPVIDTEIVTEYAWNKEPIPHEFTSPKRIEYGGSYIEFDLHGIQEINPIDPMSLAYWETPLATSQDTLSLSLQLRAFIPALIGNLSNDRPNDNKTRQVDCYLHSYSTETTPNHTSI